MFLTSFLASGVTALPLSLHFLCWVLVFFDEHSVLNILLLTNSNNELRHDIAEFEKQYQEDSRALQLMDNSPEAVEKVARVKLS